MLCSGSEIVDDVLLEALLLGLCSGSQSLMMLLWGRCLYGYGSEIGDDVWFEALFLGRCCEGQYVDDVVVEAVFLGLCYVMGVRSLMMSCWRHCF